MLMPCVVGPTELCQGGQLASPTVAGAEGRGRRSSAGCELLRPPSVPPAVPKLRNEAASSSMLLSGRGAPGCAPPGGKSTAGSGGRRTGCAASPPSGQRLAAALSRAMTSSGPSAESASPSVHASSSASLSPSPSMALNTSLSSPRTSAAVGGVDAA